MKFLLCTDGSHPAEDAMRVAGQLAAGSRAEVTILAITERPDQTEATLDALRIARDLLGDVEVPPELVARHGEPVHEIVRKTEETAFDLVVIGATRDRRRGLALLSARAYEIVRAVRPPVLVVTNARPALRHVVICTGGRDCIEPAIAFTGSILAPLGATATLLHVSADPPAIYADLVRRAENVDALLASSSELGRNLRCERDLLRSMGIECTVRVRHGDVLDQVLAEVTSSAADIVVAGSSPASHGVRRYAMGDVTRSILAHVGRPVLVVRSGGAESPRVFGRIFTGLAGWRRRSS